MIIAVRIKTMVFLGCALFAMIITSGPGIPVEVRADSFDRPAVIVGDNMILESEIQAQMQMYALQTQTNLSDPSQRAQLRERILEQMIEDRLILAEAEQDTTISVESAEVERALDEHIAGLRAQFGSDEAFEAELAREGMTLGELRRRFREDTRNQLLKQKLVNQKLGSVSVTIGEVKDFYSRYVDSLPPVPQSVKLAHILLEVKTDTNRIIAARDTLTELRARIEAGADFAEIARQYSDDPTAQVGGELGWFSPGDLVPEFEQATRRLVAGQLSGVVRTTYGYHLIEVLAKEGSRFRTRHILLTLEPNAADTARVMALADSLLTEIRNGADFCELVREYTTDIESQKNCGELGWFPIERMFPEFKDAVAGVDAGEYAGPAISEFGVHIIRVLDRQQSRQYSLEDDWDTIKQMARRQKTNEVVSDWIAHIRDETYIEVKEY